ncbi:MAG: aldo/keto reductase [Gemmatimonadetes bacterium]|nr:aldo/keto reductase [Gemmatimonadota bacterium]
MDDRAVKPATALIKGGWQLAGGHGPVDRAAALADMRAFVDAGVTAFDCADIYTGVEALIGEFLRTVPPGTVRIHTKCVPDLDQLDTLDIETMARTIQRSRERLGVAAIDLVQFHWWDYTRGDYVAAAQALADLRPRGLFARLGLTNFGVLQLKALLAAGVPIATHQVQYSLLDRRPAATMTALCQVHGIGLLCYGALAGGFFHERWLGAPEPAEPMENRSLVKYKLIIDEVGGWTRFQTLLQKLDAVARSHGVSIGAVAIRWVLEQPGVQAVIVGARHAGHLAATLAALSLAFTDRDRAEIDTCLAELTVPPGDVYELERDRSGRHGRIMRYNLSTS